MNGKIVMKYLNDIEEISASCRKSNDPAEILKGFASIKMLVGVIRHEIDQPARSDSNIERQQNK